MEKLSDQNTSVIMKFPILFRVLFLISFLIPAGVQAFSVDSVDITINRNGDATVFMQYQLNPVEKSVYYPVNMLMDTRGLAKDRLEQVFHKTVTIESIDTDFTRFHVAEFAQVKNKTYISPAFAYPEAEKLFDENLKGIKKALSVNFIPRLTVITFFDGYSESFSEQGAIKSIIHTTS